MKYFFMFVFSMMFVSTGHAERLPAPDGVYLTKNEFCQSYKKGELELIDMEITNFGRTIGFPDSLCQVATSKKIRNNRYALELDCLSYENVSQLNAIVDVKDKMILWDGEPHKLCEIDTIDSSKSENNVLAVPADKPKFKEEKPQAELKSLIDKWTVAAQNCIGGDFSDPKVLKACDARVQNVQLLQKLGYCYGTESQSRAEREWHKCKSDSLRE